MPHINMYVRDEDWPLFQALKPGKERAEWFHNALQFERLKDRCNRTGEVIELSEDLRLVRVQRVDGPPPQDEPGLMHHIPLVDDPIDHSEYY